MANGCGAAAVAGHVSAGHAGGHVLGAWPAPWSRALPQPLRVSQLRRAILRVLLLTHTVL